MISMQYRKTLNENIYNIKERAVFSQIGEIKKWISILT